MTRDVANRTFELFEAGLSCETLELGSLVATYASCLADKPHAASTAWWDPLSQDRLVESGKPGINWEQFEQADERVEVFDTAETAGCSGRPAPEQHA